MLSKRKIAFFICKYINYVSCDQRTYRQNFKYDHSDCHFVLK